LPYAGDGLAGTLLYELPRQDYEVLVPLLYWGQWAHVGQSTTAGLGHYQLLAPVG
jgi:hypothetical protein